MTQLSILMPIGGAIATDPWRGRAFEWLQARYEALLPDAELVLGTSDVSPFSRSAARNDAFSRSSGDVLLVADADIVFHPAQVRAGLALIDAGAPWTICYRAARGYFVLTAEATMRILALPPDAEIPEPTSPDDWTWADLSWAGLLLVPRAAWETVGGYDARFTGFGYEDNAFRFALDNRVGAHARVETEYVLHLHHERTHEDNFGQPYIEHNRELCRQYELGLLP